MAFRIRELPWLVQFFIYLLLAVALIFAGEYIDLPPIFPLKAASSEKDRLTVQRDQLIAEVAKLQSVRQRHQEFRTRLAALEEQLARAQSFVPEDKQTDDFLRLLQGSAMNAQISVRRFTSRPVVFKEFYAEMPFEIEMDGGYYNLRDFFNRLAGTTRIVNASSLKLQGLDPTQRKFEYTPGTSVAGVCTVTTFYTPTQAEMAAQAPPGAAGAAGRRPGGS